MADCLKAIVFLEKDIEAVKIDLALKHDFNPIDAFRLFDRQNLGCITAEDLMDGLRQNLHFGEFSHDDIYMLFKRVDRNNLGRITYKQFNDLILPFTQEYAIRVADRKEYYGKRNTELRLYFDSETRMDFQAVWRAIFNGERQLEQLRQKISHV